MRRLTNLRFSTILVFFSIAAATLSCGNNNWEKTSSGLKYRMVRNAGGKNFIFGHYLYLLADFYDEKDSLIFTWQTKQVPVTLQYLDSMQAHKGLFYEGLNKLKVGDSAIFKINCENLYRVSLKDQIPEGVDPESEITVCLGVENMSTPEEFSIWQTNLFLRRRDETKRKNEEQWAEDIALIDEYLESYGIIPLEHESGIRYVIEREGDGGWPETGDKVRIDYVGKLLDGTRFDASYDYQAPAEFIIGNRSVIPGWEIGVQLMHQGAKYTFYIPSGLAFGERTVGKLIKPNSILVYEIELLEIQKKEE